MKKHTLVMMLLLGFICIQMTGCVKTVRTTTLHKPRADQELGGNRGFVSGEATDTPKEPAFTERKVYQLEVELPQWGQRNAEAAEKTSDSALWGNRGYIFGGPYEREKVMMQETPITKFKEKVSEIFTPEPTEECTYKARKGDTLQKISQKFYGTTKKWTLLYRANRDKLESPDELYPGQVLVIPKAKEYRK